MHAQRQTGDTDLAFFLQAVVMPRDLAHRPKIDAMTVFEGALYLGVAPAADQAAAIWRLDPVTRTWDPALQQANAPDTGRWRPILPPVLPSGFPAKSLPGQHAGFVDMAVFQGADDAAPCLYVTTQSLTGAQLLRSTDGRVFDTVLSVPASEGYLGLTGLAVWSDRLVMTSSAHLPEFRIAAMTGGGHLPRGCVLASRAPARADQWEVLSEPGFGDPENLSLTALAVHGSKLYAGTENPAAGFQIWSRDAEGGASSSDWTCVMRQGAARHGMSPQVALLASHRGRLWIGTATDEPVLPELDWPAAELLRLEQDNDWQLIAGEARLTPQGLRRPLSCLGPGLDDPGVTRLGVMTAIPGEDSNSGLILGGGPLVGLWVCQDGKTWESFDLDEADEDEDEETKCGVTAMVSAEGRLWIAMDSKLFGLEKAA